MPTLQDDWIDYSRLLIHCLRKPKTIKNENTINYIRFNFFAVRVAHRTNGLDEVFNLVYINF